MLIVFAACNLRGFVSQDENSGGGAVSPVNPLSDMYAVLEGSALIPFLESKLQANSFLEIGRHTSVYRMVIGIIRELGAQGPLVSLLGPLPDQAASIHSLLQNLESQARIMISRIGRP
jgi:baculoviral IAP repeat-containing protein 6